MASSRPIVALAGGVGAARLLRGLVRAVPPERVVAIVNTGDDRSFYGVHVSPDLDIVTYTLAGCIDNARGYGIEGDSFEVVDALGRLGHETWFRLGDRDFAHCQHRTLRLRDGTGLASVTDEIRTALGVTSLILPMSEDACPTVVELKDGSRAHFEEYLVRDGAPDNVASVDLAPAQRATPGPGVIDAIRSAETLIFSPSNPVVSIGPILAIPGVREAIEQRSAPTVGVSPIVGGAAVKGPADALLRGVGAEVSARGVARLYRDLVQGFVIDERDRAEASDLDAMGLRAKVVDTIMRDVDASTRLARDVLELADALR